MTFSTGCSARLGRRRPVVARAGPGSRIPFMATHRPRLRLVTWCAVAGYTLMASGLPLPVGSVMPTGGTRPSALARLAGKDRSRPFPCMDKPCGCGSAAQCFTNCCCHSPAETLAWARAHGIQPATLAVLERRVGMTLPKADAMPASCCRSQPTVSECCAAEPRTSAVDFRDGHAPQPAAEDCCAAEPQQHGDPEAREPVSNRMLSLRAMLACGGLVADWLTVGVSLPPPPVTLQMLWSPYLGLAIVRPSCAGCDQPAPDAPPPRVA
jgi:hypothetical protein